MLCDKCNKNEAIVHYTEIINEKKREVHLCNECASNEKGINFNFDFDLPFSIKDIFSSLSYTTKSDEFINTKQLTCPKCNSTYKNFRDTGRLGCDQCYLTFKEQVVPIIQKIHGYTDHIGKVPKKSGAKLRMKNKIRGLRIELNKCIQTEEFEKAAQIRDEIKSLERDIND